MKNAGLILIAIVILAALWIAFDIYTYNRYLSYIEACILSDRCVGSDLQHALRTAQPVKCIVRETGFSIAVERQIYAMNDYVRVDVIDLSGRDPVAHFLFDPADREVRWSEGSRMMLKEPPHINFQAQSQPECSYLSTDMTFFEAPPEVLDPDSA
jgi:hypothetical protein